MSADLNLNEALGVLDEKLQSLNAMMLANQFLVNSLRDHKAKLNALDAEGARGFLRKSARVKFSDDEDSKDVLAILEQVLAPRQTADIIQFPGR